MVLSRFFIIDCRYLWREFRVGVDQISFSSFAQVLNLCISIARNKVYLEKRRNVFQFIIFICELLLSVFLNVLYFQVILISTVFLSVGWDYQPECFELQLFFLRVLIFCTLFSVAMGFLEKFIYLQFLKPTMEPSFQDLQFLLRLCCSQGVTIQCVFSIVILEAKIRSFVLRCFLTYWEKTGLFH